MEIEFKEDELEYINETTGGRFLKRCEACGHLDMFHNYHCCEFCVIYDCKCENGAVSAQVIKAD